ACVPTRWRVEGSSFLSFLMRWCAVSAFPGAWPQLAASSALRVTVLSPAPKTSVYLHQCTPRGNITGAPAIPLEGRCPRRTGRATRSPTQRQPCSLQDETHHKRPILVPLPYTGEAGDQ